MFSLLSSFAYLDSFQKHRGSAEFRSWILDSGAYSALNSGVTISLPEYIDTSAQLLQEDDLLEAVFALDVIGDPEASIRNTEAMWEQGVEAIPTFHYGSDWSYLVSLAEQYPKIALGGLVQRGAGGHGTRLKVNQKIKFLEQCFARIWPKWIHGFGCIDEVLLKRFPFCSVDSTTWCYGVARYGAVRLAGQKCDSASHTKLMPSSNVATGIRTNLTYFADLEQDTRSLFGRVLSRVSLPEFQLRLACAGPEMKYLCQS